MDSSNRRDFIKATAAAGLVTASEASARPTRTAQSGPAGSRARLAEANPVKIGFLHSTNFESDLEDAFFSGLRDSGAYEGDPKKPIDPSAGTTRVRIKKRIHNGNYGPAGESDDLNKLGKVVHGGNVKLAIATGGLVSAQAVWAGYDSSFPKIFAIVGRADSTMPQQVIAWNMDSVAHNKNRIDNIKSQFPSANLKSGDIWLLFNSNSVMAATVTDPTSEQYDWKHNLGGGGYVDANSSGHNEDINFANAFRAAVSDGEAKAIVVSADPFFFNQRGLIITAARQYPNVIMCYPNTEYWVSGGKAANSMSYGPTLANIYKDVGLKAAAYLADSGTTITPDRSVLVPLVNGGDGSRRR